MLKKYKITLPCGEKIFVIQTEKPNISAECKTTIMVDDEEYEYDGEYDESDVNIEEFDVNFDDIKYLAKKELEHLIITKPFDIKYTITFKTNILKQAIEQNIDFSHKEKIRGYLCGVHFNFKEDNIDIVATSGHTLSFVRIPNTYGFVGKITIPLPVVQHILDCISNNEEEIRLGFDKSLKLISFNGQSYELIDGAAFPDYNRIIPKEFEFIATIPTQEFRASVDNYSCQEGVLLKFDNNGLHFESNNIDCKFSGNIDVKLNVSNLSNVMKQINGNEFLFQANGSDNRVVIQEVDSKNKIYVICVMPI